MHVLKMTETASWSSSSAGCPCRLKSSLGTRKYILLLYYQAQVPRGLVHNVHREHYQWYLISKCQHPDKFRTKCTYIGVPRCGQRYGWISSIMPCIVLDLIDLILVILCKYICHIAGLAWQLGRSSGVSSTLETGTGTWPGTPRSGYTTSTTTQRGGKATKWGLLFCSITQS